MLIDFNLLIIYLISVGARVNNIICEETVGLFSSLQRRSPNATILNIAAKIKCTKNKIIPHLMSLDKKTRNNMIMKCVSLAAKVKKKSIEERIAMREDIVWRVNKKILERNQLKRRQGERARKLLEQKVKAFFCTGNQADLKFTDEQLRTMTQLVEGDDVVERFIQHIWYDKDTKKDLIWSGRIVGIDCTATGEPTLKVDYWKPENTDEQELGPSEEMQQEDADTTPMCVYQLATDFYRGDMWFL